MEDVEFKALVTEVETFAKRLNSALREIKDPDVLAETLAPFSVFAPRIVGQILMVLLDNPLGWDSEDKIFWAEVAAQMGPDWIEEMRFKAAFMAAVDGFEKRS